jgi:nicotinamidase/pyrazinamidase
MLKIGDSDAFLVIDVQNDFCPGGSLAISNGNEVVPIINRLAERFRHVILTQDWHPTGHESFASSHAGKSVYDSFEAPYGPQTLWPDHCVQGTNGAEFHKDLNLSKAELILRKGFRRNIDSYSAFRENDHLTSTGLAGYLQERGFRRVFLAGLAYDYCVRFSAIDGKAAGFDSFVIEDACRSVGLADSVEATNLDFARVGIQRVQCPLLLNQRID